jgi:hypothetical protein
VAVGADEVVDVLANPTGIMARDYRIEGISACFITI